MADLTKLVALFEFVKITSKHVKDVVMAEFAKLFEIVDFWNKFWNKYKKNPSRIASKGVFGDSYRTQIK